MFIELTKEFDDTKVLILASTILQLDVYKRRTRDGEVTSTRIITSKPSTHRPYSRSGETDQPESIINSTAILVSEDYEAVKFLLKLQGGI